MKCERGLFEMFNWARLAIKLARLQASSWRPFVIHVVVDWRVALLNNKLPSRCMQKSLCYSFLVLKADAVLVSRCLSFIFEYKSKDLASESPAFLKLSTPQGPKRAVIISQKVDLTQESGWYIWIQRTKQSVDLTQERGWYIWIQRTKQSKKGDGIFGFSAPNNQRKGMVYLDSAHKTIKKSV